MEMSPTHFKDMMETMLRTIVSEIRKPPLDPVKEAQKKREVEQRDKNNKGRWDNALARLLRCNHARQDGTCVIAWATQSDGKERGFCPNCTDLSATLAIGPELAQMFPDRADEMKKFYDEQRRRPRGLMESVRYVA